jgi:hypothetical protein
MLLLSIQFSSFFFKLLRFNSIQLRLMCLNEAYMNIINRICRIHSTLNGNLERNDEINRDSITLYLGRIEALLQLVAERNSIQGVRVEEERRRSPSSRENWRNDQRGDRSR